MNRLYPLFLNLEGKRCLVVGGGGVAERKVKSLLNCGADVTVIAPVVTEYIERAANEGGINLERRSYEDGDVEGYFLIIGATDMLDVNESIAREAEEAGLLYNIVDLPELCNFFVPSVVSSGDLKIAISTNGRSPALAKKIRQELERQYGEEYAYFLEYLGGLREKLLRDKTIDEKRRKQIFEDIVNSDALEYLRKGDKEKFQEEAGKWI